MRGKGTEKGRKSEGICEKKRARKRLRDRDRHAEIVREREERRETAMLEDENYDGEKRGTRKIHS